jgi:hypothetical protein
VQTFPKAKKFRSNKASFPLFDELRELYDGKFFHTSHSTCCQNRCFVKCELLVKKKLDLPGVRPPLAVLRNRIRPHAGQENPRTPLPPLHKGHVAPCECQASGQRYTPLPQLGRALTCALRIELGA